MPLRLRRGTDTERQSITPQEGELIYVTDTKELWAGDGVTVGGIKVTGNIPENLNDLNDVDTVSNAPQIGQVLKWDGSTFVPADDSTNVSLSMNDLTDVDLIGIDIGNSLVWNGNSFVPGDSSGISEGSNYRINIVSSDSTLILDSDNRIFTGNLDGDLVGLDSSLIVDQTNRRVNADLTGDVIGDLTGNVTGDVNGNVIGNVTGDLTGNVIGNVNGNVIGELNGNVYGNVFGNVTGFLDGSVSGDLVGLDSSLIVDQTNRRVNADLTGNVTGDLTGNVTGNVTGDVIGNMTGTFYGDLFGNLIGDSSGTHFGEVRGNMEGDLIGSVFGDDSTLIVDGLTNTLYGSLVGDVTGNLTGNVTGDVTGDLTGNVTGNVTGSVDGNLVGELQGSVFSNDSVILVDGNDSKIKGEIELDFTTNLEIYRSRGEGIGINLQRGTLENPQDPDNFDRSGITWKRYDSGTSSYIPNNIVLGYHQTDGSGYLGISPVDSGNSFFTTYMSLDGSTGIIEIFGTKLKIGTSSVPASSIGAAGDTTGMIAVDDDYIYRCILDYDGTTDIWRRLAWTGGTW